MFSDIGNKIKMVAMIFCLLGIAASVIAGIVMLVIFEGSLMGFAISAGVVVGGSVLSWLASLLFYGFGELIDETKRNREINAQLLQKLAGQDREPVAKRVESAPVSKKQETPKPTSAGEPWQCRCGTRNAANQIFCSYCGEMNLKQQTKLKMPQQTAVAAPKVNAATGNPARMTANMWTCSCGRKNSQGNKNCTFCGRDR